MASQADQGMTQLCGDAGLTNCTLDWNLSSVEQEEEGEEAGLISPEVGRIVEIILAVFINGSISCIGLFTNLINIIVFTKQGFKDSVTISLMALTLADVWGLMCMFNMCVCFGLREFAEIKVIDPLTIVYLAGSWPHAMFNRMSTWITVYICAERFLCVFWPLKVKSVITPKKTTIYILVIYCLMVACYVHIFATYGVEWRFDPQLNMTRLMMWVSSNRGQMEDISGVMNGALLPAVAMALIITSTCALVSSLKTSSSWREKHAGQGVTSTSQTDTSQKAGAGSSSRDTQERKVVAMVTAIAIICVLCTLPEMTINIVRRFFPELDANRRYRYTNVLMYYVKYTIQNVNATVNILIYYRMSSRYRTTLRNVLHLKDVSKKVGATNSVWNTTQ